MGWAGRVLHRVSLPVVMETVSFTYLYIQTLTSTCLAFAEGPCLFSRPALETTSNTSVFNVWALV